MSYIPARPKRWRPDFTLTIINIVFLLLLFYLSTGSLIKSNELEAEIPFTADLPLEKLPRPLLLATANGELFLDGRAIRRGDLARELAQAAGPDAHVNLLAERSMSGPRLLDLLAEIRMAGVPARLVTLHADLRDAPPS